MATKDEAEERSEPSPKKKGKLLKIVLALTVLAGGGGGAAWYMKNQPATEQSAAAKEVPPTFFALDPFTVNLRSEAEDQYLQVGLTLKVIDSTTTMDALRLHTPEIRNRILLLLSDKKASEVASSEGKQQLSTEILDAIRQVITAEKAQQEITDVLFTSFVIQ